MTNGKKMGKAFTLTASNSEVMADLWMVTFCKVPKVKAAPGKRNSRPLPPSFYVT